MDPIAICTCGAAVAPEQIGAVAKENDKIILTYECKCKTEGKRVMDAGPYQDYLVRWENHRKWGKPYNPEAVGKEVQAFRIDLDAVTDVGDFLLFWHDQETWEPWTIPHEKRPAPL